MVHPLFHVCTAYHKIQFSTELMNLGSIIITSRLKLQYDAKDKVLHVIANGSLTYCSRVHFLPRILLLLLVFFPIIMAVKLKWTTGSVCCSFIRQHALLTAGNSSHHGGYHGVDVHDSVLPNLVIFHLRTSVLIPLCRRCLLP